MQRKKERKKGHSRCFCGVVLHPCVSYICGEEEEEEEESRHLDLMMLPDKDGKYGEGMMDGSLLDPGLGSRKRGGGG